MKKLFLLSLIIPVLALVALLPAGSSHADENAIVLTLAGYAVPREAYSEVIPAFQAYWKAQTGQEVVIQESYQGSGAQSRAVAGGFEADIVALSIESDVTRIVDAGLITHDWKAEYDGFVTNSLVVLVTRDGNPQDITDWDDLAGDVDIITPDPATSGGAQWNILGALGAAQRGFVDGVATDEASTHDYLGKLIKNVLVFDRDGRESFLTFENGIGDVAITYENEYYAGIQAGGSYQIVYPRSTILIQNPIAVVDVYADEHGVREVADAFVAFTRSPEAQRIFVQHGFRPVNPDVAAEIAADPDQAAIFPDVEDLFTIEEFDGWGVVRKDLFGDDGSLTQLIAEVKGG